MPPDSGRLASGPAGKHTVRPVRRYLSGPPMAYLTRWRLQLAARRLTSTPRSVAEIAGDVGYESEAAFSRAFKREFGSPPAKFRRERRTEPTGAPSGRSTAQG